jgi:cyclopropane fatty-acyl-phospholipid synthase-like methyltransferase
MESAPDCPASASAPEAPAIKTMQLYSHMDRIWNELKECGIGQADVVPVEVLNRFDCLNYGGASGAARSVAALGVDASSTVLDVGAGLGGPARCVSAVSGARVLGVELQADLAALGSALTARCACADRVSIVCGDILDERVALGADASFDAAMSWLVILHIPLSSRDALFQRLHRLLKPGARVYIEDFYRRGALFTAREQTLLAAEVYVPGADLPSREQYTATCAAAGFGVSFEDVSGEWAAFTRARRDAWQGQRERHERVHNAATWESLDRFYCAIVELFENGNLGGVRLVLTRN